MSAARRSVAAAPAVAVSRTPGVVIVGAGLAGRAVAEAVRALDASVPITMVTALRRRCLQQA